MMKTWAIVLLLIAASCTSIKKTMNTDIEAIRFGNGGGVTGVTNIFILKPDGTVAKETRSLQSETLGTVAKDKTTALFKKAAALKDYQYSKPGNMYSFVELVEASGNNKIVWGVPVDVDTNVIRLYNELTQLPNSLNK